MCLVPAKERLTKERLGHDPCYASRELNEEKHRVNSTDVSLCFMELTLFSSYSFSLLVSFSLSSLESTVQPSAEDQGIASKEHSLDLWKVLHGLTSEIP